MGLIEEPDWNNFAEQFDGSVFEIYTTRALAEVEEVDHVIQSRAVQAKQYCPIQARQRF